MADNIHPVVELLAARMESNPEEFAPDGEGRWAQWLDELIPFVTEAERVMLRGPMMQTFHEQVLDELLNGPDKRRKEAEDREYERHLAAALQHTKQQAMQQQLQGYRQALGGGGDADLAQGAYDYDLDRYRNTPTGHLPVANGGTAATTGTLTNTINQIKEMLGTKK